YLGSQYLLRSDNKGDSWQTISPDLTTDDPEKQKQNKSGGLTIDNSTAENHCTIYTISESPKDANVVWAGTDDGNLQVTEDGGASWTNVVKNIPGLPSNTWCSSVEASSHDRATAYATFDGHRHGDKKTYFYKTSDMGKSWQSLATDAIEGYALDVKEDPVSRNLLFLGTEFGLYVSVDGGQQWARFTGNLPKVGIREIAIHPREADVILATHGRGIMIIDDITPLREITPEVLASDVYILHSRPSTISIPAGVQQFNANDQFVGQNPSEVATISYYLKKRHIFGDMKVEIHDPAGKLVKTLAGGKRRGINRVDWAMRKRAPRVPRAATLAFGAMFGPMVDPGAYTVKVVKGDKSYEGELEIIHDPKYAHSVADRNLQQQTVMKLYNMQEHLAYIAEATTSARDQAKKLAEGRKKGDGLAKDLKAFADKLDTFHKTLVATRQGGFITGEEQLRERLTTLYASVSGYAGKPTQSELDRMSALGTELGKAETQFKSLMSKDLPAINKKLEKKKLAAIEVASEEEFREKQQ
ncbi:MAG: WD40/YVTN/BNR-like repeat-containing protein, partial [bacterium]